MGVSSTGQARESQIREAEKVFREEMEEQGRRSKPRPRIKSGQGLAPRRKKKTQGGSTGQKLTQVEKRTGRKKARSKSENKNGAS